MLKLLLLLKMLPRVLLAVLGVAVSLLLKKSSFFGSREGVFY